MTSTRAQKIVIVAGAIALTTGVCNSMFQNKRPPSPQFLIGIPGLFLGFWVLAKSEPDLANAFAAATATYAVIGDKGGILARMAPRGEMNTAPPHAASTGIAPHEGHRAVPPRYWLPMVPPAVESSN